MVVVGGQHELYIFFTFSRRRQETEEYWNNSQDDVPLFSSHFSRESLPRKSLSAFVAGRGHFEYASTDLVVCAEARVCFGTFVTALWDAFPSTRPPRHSSRLSRHACMWTTTAHTWNMREHAKTRHAKKHDREKTSPLVHEKLARLSARSQITRMPHSGVGGRAMPKR